MAVQKGNQWDGETMRKMMLKKEMTSENWARMRERTRKRMTTVTAKKIKVSDIFSIFILISVFVLFSFSILYYFIFVILLYCNIYRISIFSINFD